MNVCREFHVSGEQIGVEHGGCADNLPSDDVETVCVNCPWQPHHRFWTSAVRYMNARVRYETCSCLPVRADLTPRAPGRARSLTRKDKWSSTCTVQLCSGRAAC